MVEASRETAETAASSAAVSPAGSLWSVWLSEIGGLMNSRLDVPVAALSSVEPVDHAVDERQ